MLMKSSFVSYPSQTPLGSFSRTILYCIGQPMLGDDERGDIDIKVESRTLKFEEEILLIRIYLLI